MCESLKKNINKDKVRFQNILVVFSLYARLAKFKGTHILDDQKIREDNKKLRPGCPPDYPNKSFKLSFSYQ